MRKALKDDDDEDEDDDDNYQDHKDPHNIKLLYILDVCYLCCYEHPQ